ncbi:class I SAM-dependent methyltransferase [Planctomycetota bacterium]
MRPEPGKPYYTAYDKRYRAVYAQGVRYWTAAPQELRSVESQAAGFLAQTGLSATDGPHIVEFGCGEGFVGALLAKQGYRYTGLDVSDSAAEKARQRLAPHHERTQILVANVLDQSVLPAAAFDAGIDVSCLHMLVVDADRHRYLQNAFNALKPGAFMLLCNVLHSSSVPPDPVESFEAWLSLSRTDVDTAEDREAWVDGAPVTVRLPRIAARPRTLDQYRAELEKAGFRFVEGGHSDPGFVTLTVQKPRLQGGQPRSEPQ